MMAKVLRHLIIAICAASVVCAAGAVSEAQGPSGWTEVLRLSDERTFALQPTLVLDRQAFVHVFWVSRPVSDPGAPFALSHSSTRSGVWSRPEEVIMSPGGLSAAIPRAQVDKDNVMHLFWVTSVDVGDLYHASALADEAQSARAWTVPHLVQTAVYQFDAILDSLGNLHLMYASQARGMCHIELAAGGVEWSEPTCIRSCQNLREDEYDMRPRLAVSSDGDLYATWTVGDLSPSSVLAYDSRAICFSHSSDAGRTWGTALTIAETESRQVVSRNQPAWPAIAVDSLGRIHLVWVGNPSMFRYHIYSDDAGATWSQPQVAIPVGGYNNWMGLAAGPEGAIHFVAPALNGLWYNRWDGVRWGEAARFPETNGAHYSDALVTPDGAVHAVCQDHGGGKVTVGHILYAILGQNEDGQAAMSAAVPLPTRPSPIPIPSMSDKSARTPTLASPLLSELQTRSQQSLPLRPLGLAALAASVLLAGAVLIARRR